MEGRRGPHHWSALDRNPKVRSACHASSPKCSRPWGFDQEKKETHCPLLEVLQALGIRSREEGDALPSAPSAPAPDLGDSFERTLESQETLPEPPRERETHSPPSPGSRAFPSPLNSRLPFSLLLPSLLSPLFPFSLPLRTQLANSAQALPAQLRRRAAAGQGQPC